jgi:hypothetical protein
MKEVMRAGGSCGVLAQAAVSPVLPQNRDIVSSQDSSRLTRKNQHKSCIGIALATEKPPLYWIREFTTYYTPIHKGTRHAHP